MQETILFACDIVITQYAHTCKCLSADTTLHVQSEASAEHVACLPPTPSLPPFPNPHPVPPTFPQTPGLGLCKHTLWGCRTLSLQMT